MNRTEREARAYHYRWIENHQRHQERAWWQEMLVNAAALLFIVGIITGILWMALTLAAD